MKLPSMIAHLFHSFKDSIATVANVQALLMY